MSSHFCADIAYISAGLNLAHAWRHRLFEAWLVTGWFEVDLLSDVDASLPARNQYNLIWFFLTQL